MTTPAFAVRHKEPVLVRPAVATPRETKRLSDIDNQVFLRRYAPMVFFYRGGRGQANGRDPVAVVRQALGRALVPYYPLAGRLRELESGELVVDCTGEGVLFAEADADVQLAELEAAGLRPPFPYMDHLLVDAKGSGGVVNRPLLLVQVTRLLCGGFVVGIHVCHSICDAAGNAQFLSAVAELARGLPSPTILPAWSRELLRTTRHPPNARPLTAVHRSRSPRAPAMPTTRPGSETVMRTFSFGAQEIAAIKACLDPRLRETATTFEVLMAALWRARTAALELRPDEPVSLWFYCNVRGVRELGLPAGYYGNALVVAAAVTTAGELLARSLGGAVDLVQEAKAAVTTAEFVRSATDPLKSNWDAPNAFRVSDVRRAGFHRVDFGWGEPLYGGRTDAPYGMSFLDAVKNGGGGGEKGVGASIVLPRAAMDRFVSMVDMLLTQPPVAAPVSSSPQARL